MLRPYENRGLAFVNEDNPMNVIWHNDKRIRLRIRKMNWDLVPTIQYDFPQRGNCHFAVKNLPKKTFPLKCQDGDKISTRLGIVIPFQANGPSASSVVGVFLKGF